LLTGKACETVKDKNDHKITAEFPCGSIVPFKPPAWCRGCHRAAP
jgi:hypothetical protein